MTKPKPEPFDPRKFVKGLSSEQLEALSELHGEAAAGLRLLARAGELYEAPTGRDILKVFQVAESEILERLADRLDDEDYENEDESSDSPQWRSGPPTQKRIPKTAESEWIRELGHEIQAKRTGLPLPAVATHEDIQALLDATKDHPRNHLIIRTLYASGIRREELTNLKVADLYLDRNIIFVREGKYDKDRYVLIDDETSRLLADYTRNFLLTDQVFDLSTRTINRVVNGAAKKIGLRQRFKAMGHNFTVHSLRHACATHMYEEGADILFLQTVLGHLFLSTTQKYIHMGVGLLVEQYKESHPLAQPGGLGGTSPGS